MACGCVALALLAAKIERFDQDQIRKGKGSLDLHPPFFPFLFFSCMSVFFLCAPGSGSSRRRHEAPQAN
jgi:hypothetical protein